MKTEAQLDQPLRNTHQKHEKIENEIIVKKNV